jgi:arginyl-tRNA synthetase
MSTPVAQDAPPQPSLRRQLQDLIGEAWQQAVERGLLPAIEPAAAPTVEVARPTNPGHGDYASNLALKLARHARRPPLEIAGLLARTLEEQPAAAQLCQEIAVASPGFLNLRLSPGALARTIEEILARPRVWGQVRTGQPERINVEFVSANPTGPLTVGNARGAFVGDLLCRVLAAAGHAVTREYYFNDSGAQVRHLGASVIAVRRGEPIPPDGYHGDYVADLARDLPPELAGMVEAGADSEVDNELAWRVGRWASERIRAGIEASLARLGVHFDVWKTERSLYDEGWVQRAVEALRAAGHLYEQDGALWFRSTAFGDDKDRVVIRSTGEPTYFASDIGYVLEKFSRGFDRLIYIWGADHHGTVARVRNAAQALGFDKERVQMILTGWVRFVRDGVEVSMSKRAGTFVTLDELLAEVGVDAARWTFGSRGANLDIDFDIELAKRQSAENPVYYVQYAHARIASILRVAAERGLGVGTVTPALLAGSHDAPDAALARVVVRLPEVVEDAAAAQETQGITAYATELATAFHAYYRDARVVDAAAPERSAERLALVLAAKVTLANALGLLGISAPESM